MTVPSGVEWSLANTRAPPSGAGGKARLRGRRPRGGSWGEEPVFSKVPDAVGGGGLGSVGHRGAVRLWSVEGFHHTQKETRF